MAIFKEIKTDNKVLKIILKLIPLAFDWLIIYLLWEIKAYVYNHIPVYERKFSIYDETISYPYKKATERLNWYDLLHYTLIASCTIIVIVQLLKRSWLYNLHQAILGLFLSYLITNLFTDYIKNFAGRYRPDFLTVCDVDFKKVEEQFLYYQNLTGSNINIDNFGPRKLFDTSICRCDKSEIPEEQKSFPSGHTSFAFATMVYLALYLAGQLRIFDGKCRVWKYFIVCIPIFAGSYVPFSRVMDYRHHWQDVFAGALIGTIFAITVYYFMYPSLHDPNCDIPYRGTLRNKNKKEKVKIDEIEQDDIPKNNNPEEIV